MQRRSKPEEVTRKEYGDTAQAEELEQAKDAKKKIRNAYASTGKQGKRMANNSLVSAQLCTGPNS